MASLKNSISVRWGLLFIAFSFLSFGALCWYGGRKYREGQEAYYGFSDKTSVESKKIIEIPAMEILESEEFKKFNFEAYAGKIRKDYPGIPIKGDRLLIDFKKKDDIGSRDYYQLVVFLTFMMGREEPRYLRFKVRDKAYIQPFPPVGKKDSMYNLKGEKLTGVKSDIYSFVKVVVIPFNKTVEKYRLFNKQYDDYDSFFKTLKEKYKDKPGIIIDIYTGKPKEKPAILLRHITPLYESARLCGIDIVYLTDGWKLTQTGSVLQPTITCSENGEVTEYKTLHKGDFEGHPWIESPEITSDEKQGALENK